MTLFDSCLKSCPALKGSIDGRNSILFTLCCQRCLSFTIATVKQYNLADLHQRSKTNDRKCPDYEACLSGFL